MKGQNASTVPIVLSALIAVLGLALVFALVSQPNLMSTAPLIQRGLVGFLYCMLCSLGITAVFYPTKCKGAFQHVQNTPTQTNKSSKPLEMLGHHPNCQNFSSNRIKIAERTFCAACSGLLIGATIALTGTTVYFSVGANNAGGSIWLVALGEIFMLVGLIQIKFPKFTKTFLNAVFVVGSFLILVEVDSLGKSFFLDLYVFGLILFLLWFRILLSEWNNRRICQKCQRCFH